MFRPSVWLYIIVAEHWPRNKACHIHYVILTICVAPGLLVILGKTYFVLCTRVTLAMFYYNAILIYKEQLFVDLQRIKFVNFIQYYTHMLYIHDSTRKQRIHCNVGAAYKFALLF